MFYYLYTRHNSDVDCEVVELSSGVERAGLIARLNKKAGVWENEDGFDDYAFILEPIDGGVGDYIGDKEGEEFSDVISDREREDVFINFIRYYKDVEPLSVD